MRRSRGVLLCILSAFLLVAAACVPPPTAPGNAAPKAILDAAPTSGAAPLTVNFDGSASTDSDGTVTDHSWNFGDGSPDETFVTGSHVYAENGVYTATLTVGDNKGKAGTATVTITVGTQNDPPVAVISASQTSGSAPLTVQLDGSGSTDSDGTVDGYEWNFGDGSATASTAQASHVFTDAGSYVVTLTVTDNDGAQNTTTKTITVGENVAPTAAASATPSAGKAPLPVQFSANGSTDSDGTIASYAWTFGDGGTSTSADPAHTYSVAGTYTATLVVTDNGGATDSATVSVQVNLNQAPIAVANSNVTAGQAPLTVNFSSVGSVDDDGTIVSQSWTFGDGNGSTSATPAYTY
ncbi:MAG TPA: PKD domain-containing protein, partial [Microthrixaceae bacterium]|nr:PKD domain-containing protein [Microthrixaceae bacterium]